MKNKVYPRLYFYLLFFVLFSFFSINAQAYTWVRVHPAIVGDINDVACDTTNDICVAVGKYGDNNQYGEILYRDSSGNWRQLEGQYPPLYNVEYGDGKFLISGNHGKIYMSSDGQNWSNIYDNSSHSVSGIVYGDGKFIVIGNGGRYLICDPNSESCSLHSELSSNFVFYTIVYDGSKFLISGYKFLDTSPWTKPYILTSTDGTNWNEYDITNNLGNPANNIRSIAYGNSKFVGAGLYVYSGDNMHAWILSSNNGTSWTTERSNLDWSHILGFCNGFFFSFMEDLFYNRAIYNSSDGSSWSEVSSLSIDASKVTPSDSGCVAVGDDGYIAESSDGDNWIRVSQSNEELDRIKYLNNYFYAVGYRGTVIYSNDGNTWTEETISSMQDYVVTDIAYDGSTLVAVGRGWNVTGGFIAHKNGNSWTVDNTPSFSLYGITYGGGKFIAVGHGKILSSTDGSNWTEVNISDNISNIYLKSVIYADGKFVVVGSDGTILTSSDGTNWTKDNSTTTKDLKDITYAGKFVAVGSSGTVLISEDGEDWSQASQSPSSAWFTSVTYDGNKFVALDSHKVYTSKNGDSWTNSGQIPTFYYSGGMLRSVTSGNGMLVAVGDKGLIFRSYTSGLSATISSSANTTYIGQALTFICSAIGGSGIYTYYWDFNGDGIYDNTTTNSSTTYTYNSYGIYYAKVKVVDSDNNTAISSPVEIKVKPENGDVGSVNVSIDNTTVFSVTGVVDNATVDNMSSTLSINCNSDDCSSLVNQGISFKYAISVGLILNGNTTSTRITLKNLPLFPGVENIFFKDVNDNFIDLTNNQACGNCNFTRTDNSTTHTTTISFTLTDGGVLDADGEVNGIITDPIILGTTSSSNTNEPPVIDSYTVTPTSGTAPLTVIFRCNAHDPDGTIVRYEWDFNGDGYVDKTTTNGIVTYTYSASGVYNSEVSVVDNIGLRTSRKVLLHVAKQSVVPASTIENALKDIISPEHNVNINHNSGTNIFEIIIEGVEFPIVIYKTGKGFNIPEKPKLEFSNHGLFANLVLTDGSTFKIVPIVADFNGLKIYLENLGFNSIKIDMNNGILECQDSFHNSFVAMFGWITGTGESKIFKEIVKANGILNVLYNDGTIQAFPPAVASLSSFIKFLEDRNIQFTIDRITGVINVENGSSCWRPDYTIRPISSSNFNSISEWFKYLREMQGNKVYFKDVGDVNGDGLKDIEMWSTLGKQIIYQIPCR